MSLAYNTFSVNNTEQVEVTPTTYEEALKLPTADKWKEANDAELYNLKSKGTYIEVPETAVPKGRKPLTTKTVFRKKYNPQTGEVRYKARVVVRGFQQEEGLDYSETFAPVVQLDSLRLLVSIAAKYNLPLYQMDVDGAFLHGLLEEEIYVYPP